MKEYAKTILIVCRYFYPENEIASLRPTKMAKYLKQNFGFRIVVISSEFDKFYEPIEKNEHLPYVDEHLYMRPCRIFVWILKKRLKRAGRLNWQIVNENEVKSIDKKLLWANEFDRLRRSSKQKIFNTFRDLIDLLIEKSYSRRAIRVLNKRGIDDIDVLFSTYGPYSVHWVAQRILDKNSGIFWVADFRDATSFRSNNRVSKSYRKKYLLRTFEKAGLVTAVSEGCFIPLSKPEHAVVIPNGFDSDDIVEMAEEYGECLEEKTLTFAYCGTLYRGKSDFRLFFKALEELIKEELIEREKIRFIYAGIDGEEFTRQSDAWNLSDKVEDVGLLSRQESLRIQQCSDILLLASWNNRSSWGVITGKFYEQLMFEKPIVCIVTGDLPNSTLKEMISKASVGICCEEAGGECDYLRMKDYLLNCYRDWEKGKLSISTNKSYTERFHYKNLVSKLVDCLNSSTYGKSE